MATVYTSNHRLQTTLILQHRPPRKRRIPDTGISAFWTPRLGMLTTDLMTCIAGEFFQTTVGFLPTIQSPLRLLRTTQIACLLPSSARFPASPLGLAGHESLLMNSTVTRQCVTEIVAFF